MNTNDYFEEIEDDGLTIPTLVKGHRDDRFPTRHPKKLAAKNQHFVETQDDSRKMFKFSYKAARFEEGWLLNSLGGFYEHKWILDVYRRLKGGKEASVYLCQAGAEVDAELVACKVYRPRSLRNLRNDHAYREGRIDLDGEGKIVLDDGMQHAMNKRTEYGKGLLHQSWIAYEFTTMQALKNAGADVPTPYEMAGNAILMGYVGDVNRSAPTLSEISLDRHEAKIIYERVIKNINILLDNHRIHGDLSAYNILYWDGDITLIDFPQVVSPGINRNAFRIFQRDVTRVCEYFCKQGLQINDKKLALELWEGHGLRVETQVDIRFLDADDPKDRELWQKQK